MTTTIIVVPMSGWIMTSRATAAVRNRTGRITTAVGPWGDVDLDPLDLIGHEDAGFERSEERASLEPALDELPERERLILRMRFEDGLTQTEIADRVGISQMHVSRLIRRSLERLGRELG